MPEGKSGPVLLCKVLLCCVFFLGFVRVITGLVQSSVPAFVLSAAPRAERPADTPSWRSPRACGAGLRGARVMAVRVLC